MMRGVGYEAGRVGKELAHLQGRMVHACVDARVGVAIVATLVSNQSAPELLGGGKEIAYN